MSVIQVRLLPDGGLLVSGRPAPVPAGMTAEAAAIERVRVVVETRDEAARVEIERADGTHVVLVVETDGSVVPVPVTVPAQAQPGPPVALPIPLLLRGHRPAAPEGPADPADSAPAGGPAPGGRRPPPRVRATRTRLPPEREQAPPRRRRRLVVGGVLAALVVGGLVATSLGGGDSAKHAQPAVGGAAAQGAELRVPVPGWSKTAAWSVAVAAPGKGAGTVVTGAASAAAITPDQSAVLLLDLRTGRTLARVPLPTDGPLHGTYATTDRAAVHMGPHLVVLPLDGSPTPARTLDVPPGSRVSTTGTSLLVTYPANGAMVLLDGGTRLNDVRLPSGSTQLAADGAEVIATLPAGRWWRSRSGVPSAEVTALPPREGATVRQVRAGGHGRVIVLWSGPADGSTTVAVHDASTGAVVMRADAPSDQLADASWRWDGGPLAALGPLVLDLGRGSSRLVPGLAPATIVDGTLYGRRGAAERVAITATDPDRVTSLGQDGPLPLGGSGGRVLVLDLDGAGAMTLYGLERS